MIESYKNDIYPYTLWVATTDDITEIEDCFKVIEDIEELDYENTKPFKKYDLDFATAYARVS